MTKKKIDELEKTIKEAIQQFGTSPALYIHLASHLKKEGYAKLPGKYVVKKGCLVRLDD